MESFDLSKYIAHDWFELARFDNNFEKGNDCSYITWGESISDTLVNANVCSYDKKVETCASGTFGYADPNVRNGHTVYTIEGTLSYLKILMKQN